MPSGRDNFRRNRVAPFGRLHSTIRKHSRQNSCLIAAEEHPLDRPIDPQEANRTHQEDSRMPASTPGPHKRLSG